MKIHRKINKGQEIKHSKNKVLKTITQIKIIEESEVLEVE